MASAPPSSAPAARPQSVKELVAQAEDFSFNTNIPLKHWFRAAETLYQEASFALADGDYGRAYVMLYRHSTLILQYIPTHPQYKDPESRKAYKALSGRIPSVVEDLEHLKPTVEEAYKEWERMKPPKKSKQEQPEHKSYAHFAARDPSLSGNATTVLDAGEHQDLAVDLAQQELSRRDTARRATRHAGQSDQGAHGQRRTGLWDTYERRPPPGDDDLDLQRRIEATRRTLESPRETQDGPSRDSTYLSSSNRYNYPSVPRSRPIEYERAPLSTQSQTAATEPQPPQPPRPPKDLLWPERLEPVPHAASRDIQPPELPRKTPFDDYKPSAYIDDYGRSSDRLASAPALPSKEPLQVPTPPKKGRLTFKPGAYLENGDPIRSVFLPSQLRKTFLEIASKNTQAGLETCGILCGTPVNNALFIRCLLIPDQKSTSDTCETENEGAVFDYCDKEDLIVVGWIHTHPTQTCFMSSRDLHTQAGYQVMMPESVAIVCSPRYKPSYGIFRLTHPPGLNHILQCSHTDTFHPHSINNLYREAERPHGHVYESDRMELYTKDLRTK